MISLKLEPSSLLEHYGIVRLLEVASLRRPPIYAAGQSFANEVIE
jgi:hypothetical protein